MCGGEYYNDKQISSIASAEVMVMVLSDGDGDGYGANHCVSLSHASMDGCMDCGVVSY